MKKVLINEAQVNNMVSNILAKEGIEFPKATINEGIETKTKKVVKLTESEFKTMISELVKEVKKNIV